jgi:hypothetical protein|tara:strand:+ start:61 stop:771 length:711 start_codon:yes stop_codon:yes gene_type:complete
MLLISGCSFVDNAHLPYIIEPKNNQRRIVSHGGAGNNWISRAVLENLSGIDRVIVLFTGFSRIDVEIPIEMVGDIESYYSDTDKPMHYTKNKQSVWFHSGGWDGTWCNWPRTRYADYMYKYMQSQYKPMNWDHHTDRNLIAIAGCLNTLEARGIPYRYGFIYDIFKDYSGTQGSLGGPVKADNPLLNYLDFNKCFKTSPYDYCFENNLLSTDNFHPSTEGYASWWAQVKQDTPWYG